MFTGIIETTGKITNTQKDKIIIDAPKVIGELKIGSSIAVDGACLTVVETSDKSFTADVMPVTFEKTVLGIREKGDLVNLELAMKHTDRFEGHVVSGHIEGTAELIKQKIVDNAYYLTFRLPEDLTRYVVAQGSIAINGISLTVIDIEDSEFSVGIIPHTWDNTNLHELEVGDKVNIETDLMAKYAEKLMSN
ncbi:riboflavin synthase [Patescibacteria group bacterium]|nr:riboflavin synthase [Patescibacteria group bacterium]MBU1682957.1 riboflavin synthase [Patescibacteria group bacterium]MBU1934869.1 riboflavin synthase [Patescibacteria group bacterium]